MQDKLKFYKNYYPPASWDKELEYKQETSEYYAIMVQKFGKAMADYYWNRKYSYENERDFTGEWQRLCKEINEKCDIFLKSRGVEVLDLYSNKHIELR